VAPWDFWRLSAWRSSPAVSEPAASSQHRCRDLRPGQARNCRIPAPPRHQMTHQWGDFFFNHFLYLFLC
jgi:hypothetical protein